MSLSRDLARFQTIFFDTAPIIYYIEAHPQFGSLIRGAMEALEADSLAGYSSVITLAEVLAKPIQMGKEALARRFASFYVAAKIFILSRSQRKSPNEPDDCAASIPR